ncbi:MAG: insulinase family protein [Treponema sp.]|nr:insulinase family protein [Treponema sp.]
MRLFFANLASIVFVLFLASLFSCASSKAKSQDDSLFYEQNLPLFKEAALSNGIPVTFKNIPLEKNLELRIIFLGGASVCPKNKAGLDQLTFDLILDCNPKIKELSSRGLYYSVSACLLDYSYCGFNCSAQDFFESLDAFAPSLLSPEYNHQDYLKKEAAASAEAFDKSENPRYELLESVKKQIYASTPYLEGPYHKKTSRVSEYDIEKNLSQLLNASRIQIIAAGNFSYKETDSAKAKQKKKSEGQLFDERAAALLEKLEGLFGTLEAAPWSAPNAGSLSVSKKKELLVRSEFAGGDYCAALCVAAPSRADEDYEAFALGTLALDSVLRRELVEAKKIASYAGSAVLNAKKSAALVLMGGVKQDINYKQSLDAALAMFPDYNDLAGVLDVYKNIYVSRVVGSSHNAGATLDQMASSAVYQKSPLAFIEKPKKIRAATVQDVTDAYEKYFRSDNSLFMLLSN